MSSQPSKLWLPLGNGVHSVVWRARKATVPLNTTFDVSEESPDTTLDAVGELSKWIAVKVVYDNRSMPPHDIVREAALLREISHPNIISMVQFIQSGPDAPYALYMPLIPLPLTVLLDSPFFTPSPLTGPYSALSKHIFAAPAGPDGVNPFGVIVKSLIYQLILAINHLHSLDPPISHRDVNPGNVLIDHEGVVKLIDFGIAWSTSHIQPVSSQEARHETESSRRHPFDGWRETEEKMCCEVATGPHRAPELLFSPRSYSATATDLWSLGTTIAQCFTPLRLLPSHSPSSSPSSATSDEEENVVARPFLIPPGLKSKIDYRAVWERVSLFNGDRGELGLAWSIFKLRGTPNEETWPAFNALPDVNKIEFEKATRRPLHLMLPHLPPVPDRNDSTFSNDVGLNESPLSLIDAFMAYPPASRLSTTEALKHPWFSADVLFPLTYPDPVAENRDSIRKRNGNEWGGRNLGQWLEPVIRREAIRLTHVTNTTFTTNH